MDKAKIKVDIISDVVCPWCYIGKKRLEKAVDQLKNNYDIEIQYHPFELNPAIPKEGYNQKEYLSNKFGGPERYDEIQNRVTAVAAAEGLDFHFEKQDKSPNTLDPHRIIWLAGKEGKQKEVVEAFFNAYFTKGIDLTQKENLIKVAVDAGLDKDKVSKLLNSDEGKREVQEAGLYNKEIGVTGVPFYIINNKYAISGAQPSDLFVKALTEIANENLNSGESCDIEGNNC